MELSPTCIPSSVDIWHPAVHVPRSCQVVSKAQQQIVAAEEPQDVAVAEVEVSGMEVGKKAKKPRFSLLRFRRSMAKCCLVVYCSESLEYARQNPWYLTLWICSIHISKDFSRIKSMLIGMLIVILHQSPATSSKRWQVSATRRPFRSNTIGRAGEGP